MKVNQSIKWDLKDVFNVFVTTFILELVLYVVVNFFGIGYVIDFYIENSVIRVIAILFLYILQIAGMLFPIWFFVLRKYKSDILDFGFYWPGTMKVFFWVIFGYLFYLGLSTFILMIFSTFGIGFIGFEAQKSIFDIFGNDPFGFSVAILIAIIIAPFVEEIFFRGFILQVLGKTMGVFWGSVITALIFAAVHFEFQSIMPLLILSFILNTLYLKTNSIWTGIVFHIFNNCITLTVLFLLENNPGLY
ncbi:CPBP family intramembrane metalloprotease [Patescibacteria group bacterium]|nr:CPBP family intramembrane metalloprotease [Patescibacteria group bacterium]